MLDHKAEYRTMEWPYASPRRGRLPADQRADRRSRSTTSSTGPTATTRSSRSTRSWPRTRATPSRGTGSSTRRSTRPRARRTPGCARACSAARRTSGAAVALRYGPLQFKAASRDGFDVDWPIGYDGRLAVLRQGGHAARLLGHQGRPRPGAGRHLPAADEAQLRRGALQARDRQDGPALHPRPRRRDHRRRAEQQVPLALPGPRALRPRLRHQRGLPLADRARSIPARDTGNLTVRPYSVVSEVFLDEATGKAGGVRVIDANTREVMDFKARVVVLGAGTPRQHAHPAQLEVGAASERARQLLGAARLLPQRAPHGPARQRLHPDAHRHRAHPRRRAADRAVHPALPQRRPTSIPTSSAAITSRAAAAPTSTRAWPTTLPGFGKAFKSNVRKYYPALISIGGFGEVLPRKENRVTLDAGR